MKRLKLTFALLVLSLIAIQANGQYEQAMGKNIPAMFSAGTAQDLLAAANNLERIANAEEVKWEPYYYAAFGNLRMMEHVPTPAEKDSYLEKALELVGKGAEASPNNSELEALRGYVIMMQLTVDPATRGQQYSGMAFNAFNKAVALNPQNPRAHFLLGQMQLGTASFMGGGDGGSCATFGNAKALFEAEKPSDNPFAPSWGKSGNEQALAACGE